MPLPFCLSPCSGKASGWRRLSARELLPIVKREAEAVGAARMSDISGLDTLTVPCCQVVRPDAHDVPGNVTVLSGKGWSAEQAQIGAYMELLERHWAERAEVPMLIERASELERRGERFIPLAVIPLPIDVADPGDEPLAWVRGTTLEGQALWVPAHEVFCPFQVPDGCHNPPLWRSTGLASGSHVTEAVLHGLLEVIERDAMALAELDRAGVSVDLQTFGSARADALLETIEREGLLLEAKRLSAIGRVHAFVAFLDDPASSNPLRMNGGHCAHVDPFLALEGAILEAVQSRASFIAGAREDLDQLEGFAALGYSKARSELSWWLNPTADTVAAPAGPLLRPDDLGQVLRELRDALVAQKFWPIVFVELSPPGSSIVVVRVIVPSCSQATPGNVRLGRRIQATLCSE